MRAFGVLLLLSALALSISRAPDRPLQSLVARWAPPPSKFVELAGMQVHLRDEGPRDDPVPVVLIHGTSASLHTWEGWVHALRLQRRVISFDLPGFGLTGPNSSGRYIASDDARFTLQLLDALKVQRFVIGGNSLGGEVAWRTAVLAPARVERLILVDATGLTAEPESIPLGWRVARVPVLGSISEWVLPRALVTQGLVQVYGHPERVNSELVDRYFEITLRDGNRAALRQRLQQWVPIVDTEGLARLTLPTLILWGGQDHLLPRSAALAFQSRINGSKLVVFEDLGHVPMEEDPARTVLPVKEFLGLR